MAKRFLCKIGLHKWIYTSAVYLNEIERLAGMPAEEATRGCMYCEAFQREEIYCLGLNPPDYVRTWINTDAKEVESRVTSMKILSGDYVLFIDDLRDPPSELLKNSLVVLARTSDDAINFIERIGTIPAFISFDHDLGGDDTGMLVVNYIVDKVCNGRMSFPDNFAFKVHSANPIGAENIEAKLNNLLDFIKRGEINER